MNSMGACAPPMYRTGESLFKSMGAWEPTIYRSPSLKVWVPGNLIDVQTGRSSPSLKVWVPGHPRHSVKGVVGNPYLKTVGVWAPRMSGLWVFWWCTAKVKITDKKQTTTTTNRQETKEERLIEKQKKFSARWAQASRGLPAREIRNKRWPSALRSGRAGCLGSSDRIGVTGWTFVGKVPSKRCRLGPIAPS